MEIWHSIGLWHYLTPGLFIFAQFALGVLVATDIFVSNVVMKNMSAESPPNDDQGLASGGRQPWYCHVVQKTLPSLTIRLAFKNESPVRCYLGIYSTSSAIIVASVRVAIFANFHCLGTFSSYEKVFCQICYSFWWGILRTGCYLCRWGRLEGAYIGSSCLVFA